MNEEHTSCPRNCGGYLFPIGETEGGTLYKCFVCESQVSRPNSDGADAQFAASRVTPPDAREGATVREQSRVLAFPEPETAPDTSPDETDEERQEREQAEAQARNAGGWR